MRSCFCLFRVHKKFVRQKWDTRYKQDSRSPPISNGGNDDKDGIARDCFREFSPGGQIKK
jgi:hypothetical protein